MGQAWAKPHLAPKPPLGWNSWDCYGTFVTEDDLIANAEAMAATLKPFGWQYVVLDIQWYEPVPRPFRDGEVDWSLPEEQRLASVASRTRPGRLEIDGHGRLLPALGKFPSSAGGRGLKPVADRVHALGLKFGLHLMRGIPRCAVWDRLPIEGTAWTADQVADRQATCRWNLDNYGVAPDRPGAQEWYDSLARLYASWGVDYLKADDMLCEPYHEGEIALLSRALARCGRPIVLSLSPGIAGVAHVQHLREHAHLWRVSHDFWDLWAGEQGYSGLRPQFATCAAWAPHIRTGHWPDADMLPLGRIGRNDARGPERSTSFTPAEQVTLMTLWSLFRSPLMYGGLLTEIDDATRRLLTNPEVLAVNQDSTDNREAVSRGDHIAWTAREPATGDTYLALFNLADRAGNVAVTLAELGLAGPVAVRDLWQRRDEGHAQAQVVRTLPPHGAALLRLAALAGHGPGAPATRPAAETTTED